MPGTRSSAAGSFVLELDGKTSGFLKSVEGGVVAADVVRTAPRARGAFVKKSLGPPFVEPFALQLGLGLDKTLSAWLADACSGKAVENDGAVVLADMNLVAKQRREFERAVIQSIGFPAWDAASKDAGFLTVRIAPQSSRERKASGSVKGTAAAKQKQWLASNFKLELDGLDCKRVSRIDGFTITCAPPLDYPDLRVTLAEAGAQTWIDWHRTFVVEGKSSDAEEKKGRIVLLAPNLKDALGEVRLHGVGIRRLAGVPGGTVARLVADLYCERMELSIP